MNGRPPPLPWRATGLAAPIPWRTQLFGPRSRGEGLAWRGARRVRLWQGWNIPWMWLIGHAEADQGARGAPPIEATWATLRGAGAMRLPERSGPSRPASSDRERAASGARAVPGAPPPSRAPSHAAAAAAVPDPVWLRDARPALRAPPPVVLRGDPRATSGRASGTQELSTNTTPATTQSEGRAARPAASPSARRAGVSPVLEPPTTPTSGPSAPTEVRRDAPGHSAPSWSPPRPISPFVRSARAESRWHAPAFDSVGALGAIGTTLAEELFRAARGARAPGRTRPLFASVRALLLDRASAALLGVDPDLVAAAPPPAARLPAPASPTVARGSRTEVRGSPTVAPGSPTKGIDRAPTSTARRDPKAPTPTPFTARRGPSGAARREARTADPLRPVDRSSAVREGVVDRAPHRPPPPARAAHAPDGDAPQRRPIAGGPTAQLARPPTARMHAGRPDATPSVHVAATREPSVRHLRPRTLWPSPAALAAPGASPARRAPPQPGGVGARAPRAGGAPPGTPPSERGAPPGAVAGGAAPRSPDPRPPQGAWSEPTGPLAAPGARSVGWLGATVGRAWREGNDHTVATFRPAKRVRALFSSAVTVAALLTHAAVAAGAPAEIAAAPARVPAALAPRWAPARIDRAPGRPAAVARSRATPTGTPRSPAVKEPPPPARTPPRTPSAEPRPPAAAPPRSEAGAPATARHRTERDPPRGPTIRGPTIRGVPRALTRIAAVRGPLRGARPPTFGTALAGLPRHTTTTDPSWPTTVWTGAALRVRRAAAPGAPGAQVVARRAPRPLWLDGTEIDSERAVRPGKPEALRPTPASGEPRRLRPSERLDQMERAKRDRKRKRLHGKVGAAAAGPPAGAAGPRVPAEDVPRLDRGSVRIPGERDRQALAAALAEAVRDPAARGPSSWRAPESARAPVSSWRAPAELVTPRPPPPRREAPEAATAPAVTERQILQVLRVLASSHPEARQLLREVLAEVASIRNRKKDRQV